MNATRFDTEAVSFEGIGGTFYGYGREPDTLPPGVVWDEGALVAPVNFGEDSIDVFSGKIKTAGITVKLNLDDNAPGNRQQTFLAQARYGRFSGQLTTDLDATTTTVNATPGLAVGTPFYVARETIVLGVESSPGVYTGSTRGAFDSDEQTHQAGDFIYDLVPFWIGRRAVYWRYTVADGWVDIWRGYVSSAPKSTGTITQVVMSLKSPFDYAKNKEVNQNVFPSQWETSRTTSHADTTHKANTVLGGVRVAQVGETIVHIQLNAFGGARLFPGTQALLSSPALDITQKNQGWPVLCISPEVDDILPSSPTISCDHPYHPLTIASAIAFSTASPDEDPLRFDVLNGDYSMGMGWTTSDTELANIRALIEATQEMRVDHFVMGYDGRREKIWPRVRDMLLAFGFVSSTTYQGYTTFKQVRQASIQEALSLTPLEAGRDTLELINPQTSINDSVIGLVGELPWREGTTVALNGKGPNVEESRVQKLDLRTKRAETSDALRVTGLTSALLYRVQAWPSIQVHINDATDDRVTLGAFVRLSGPTRLKSQPLLDVEGTYSNDLDAPAWSGLVVSRRPNQRAAGSYTLTVLNNHYSLNEWLRLRAPSATVVAVAGNVITIEQDGGYGSLGKDIFNFVNLEGYEVELWSDDGENIATAGFRVIDGIDDANDQIILDAAFGTVPIPGQVVRLARLPNFTPDPRIYVYIAGDQLPNSEADLYG